MGVGGRVHLGYRLDAGHRVVEVDEEGVLSPRCAQDDDCAGSQHRIRSLHRLVSF